MKGESIILVWIWWGGKFRVTGNQGFKNFLEKTIYRSVSHIVSCTWVIRCVRATGLRAKARNTMSDRLDNRANRKMCRKAEASKLINKRLHTVGSPISLPSPHSLIKKIKFWIYWKNETKELKECKKKSKIRPIEILLHRNTKLKKKILSFP